MKPPRDNVAQGSTVAIFHPTIGTNESQSPVRQKKLEGFFNERDVYMKIESSIAV